MTTRDVSRVQECTKGLVLTALGIGEGKDSGQETSNSTSAHDETVVEEGVDANGTLAHMYQTLRNAHNEQTVWVLIVVTRELSEHLGKTSVIRSSPYDTHGEDGI